MLVAFSAHNPGTLLTGLPGPLEELEALSAVMVHTRHRRHEGSSETVLRRLRRHVLLFQKVAAEGYHEDAVKVLLKGVHEGTYVILGLRNGTARSLLL